MGLHYGELGRLPRVAARPSAVGPAQAVGYGNERGVIMGIRWVVAIAMAVVFGCAWGDSISIDGVTYDDVYIRESPSAYFVQIPDEGRTLSVLKSDVDPSDVVISPDEGERRALLDRWRRQRGPDKGAAPAAEEALSVRVESTYSPDTGPKKLLAYEEDGAPRLVLRGDYDFDAVRGAFLAEQSVLRAEAQREYEARAREQRRRAEEEARRQHQISLRGMELAEQEMRLEEQALRNENQWLRRRPVRYYGYPRIVYRGPVVSGPGQTVRQGVTTGTGGLRWLEHHGGDYSLSSPGSNVKPWMRSHGGSYGVPQPEE